MSRPALMEDPLRQACPTIEPPLTDQPTGPDLSGLRVAFVSGNYNYLRDGANRAQNELVGFLLEHGAAVRVYSPTTGRPAFEPVGDLVSVPSTPLPFGRKEYRIALRLSRAIEEDIRAFAPNVVHISLPLFHGRSALKLARRLGVATIAAMHTRFETYPRYYGLQMFERPLLALLRRFYRGCDFVVAPCAAVAEDMKHQGMGENIGVWTRGVDTQAFHPCQRSQDWRDDLGLEPGVPVVAFLGRLVLEKGLDDFVATVSALADRGMVFRTLIIGDGPARADLEQRLPGAAFAGFLHGQALARALASADILLNPSSTEGFSNVTLEAMASGLAVVAADSIGNNNLVVDGQTGALAPPNDIAAFSEALARYVADADLRKAHGEAGRARALQFTWARANAGIADIYMGVLAARKKTAAASATAGRV